MPGMFEVVGAAEGGVGGTLGLWGWSLLLDLPEAGEGPAFIPCCPILL